MGSALLLLFEQNFVQYFADIRTRHGYHMENTPSVVLCLLLFFVVLGSLMPAIWSFCSSGGCSRGEELEFTVDNRKKGPDPTRTGLILNNKKCSLKIPLIQILQQ